MKFLKALGLGVIYILLSPFILLGIVLMMVYGIIRWLITMMIGIVRFFKGDKFFKPLPEDIETEKAMKAQHDNLVAKAAEESQISIQPAPQQNTTYVQNNYYSSPNPQQINQNFNQFDQQLNAPTYEELPQNTPYQEIPLQPSQDETLSEPEVEEPLEFPEEGGDQ